MNERSENSGLLAVIAVVVVLGLLLLVGGGFFAFYFFARQTARVQAEAAMVQEAQARLRESMRTRLVETATAAQRESATDDSAPSEDKASIVTAVQAVLNEQQLAWNAGDIDRFMQHYWNSPDLTFSSGGKTTRGWDATLKRYRDRYPTPQQMGKLTFDKLETTPLGDSAALVLGQWQVEREAEPLTGNFSLVVRKIGDKWLIIHDHTSRLAE